jgi:hypothetical protein
MKPLTVGQRVAFTPDSPVYAKGFRTGTVTTTTETLGEAARRIAPSLGVSVPQLLALLRHGMLAKGLDTRGDWLQQVYPCVRCPASPRRGAEHAGAIPETKNPGRESYDFLTGAAARVALHPAPSRPATSGAVSGL